MSKSHKQQKHKNHNSKSSNNNTKANGDTSSAPHAPTNAKRLPTLTLQKRNELSALVAQILQIGFKPAANPKEEWQQYLDTQSLLQRVVALEAPLRRPSANASAESRLANIDAFYRWATEHGVRYDGLRIAQFPGYDLGLEATRNIARDEQLFAIPRPIILSEEHLDKEFNQAQFGSMTNLKLAYALMLETLKRDASLWRPYIDLLPERYSTVLYFDVAEMEQLRGSNALSQALRQCKAIARQYAFIYNCSQQQLRSEKITPMGQLFKEQFSYELYRWAVSTVMTRENMIPRSTAPAPTTNGDDINPQQTIAALIPFWDMANHLDGTVTSFYNMETQHMESAAQMDFKKGEQIFIHYGDRSNADLMVHNGFINATNPKDSISIKLGLSPSDPLYEKRAELLQLLQIPKNSELKVLPAPDYISSELLAFVRVFNMNAEQLEHWITSERAMDLLHIDCALETSLESRTWQYLQTRLMLLMRVFPSTLEADEAQLAELRKAESTLPPLSYIGGMVLEYRVLEKRILLAALDYAKQRTKA